MSRRVQRPSETPPLGNENGNKYPRECAQASKMSRAQGVAGCSKRSWKNRSDTATEGTRGSEKICGREESYTATMNYIARRITRVMVLRGPYGTTTRHSVKILQHGTHSTSGLGGLIISRERGWTANPTLFASHPTSTPYRAAHQYQSLLYSTQCLKPYYYMQRENLIVPAVSVVTKKLINSEERSALLTSMLSLVTWTITQVYETYTSYNCGSRGLVLEIGLVSNSPGAK
jgi:hypothetical protein